MKLMKKIWTMLMIMSITVGVCSCDLFSHPQDNKPPVDDTPPDVNPPDVNPPDDNNPPIDDNPTVSVTEIRIQGAKIDYAFGEDLTTDGIEVIAIMSDSTEKTLTNDEYTVKSDSFNPMKVGSYDVTVSVKGTDITKNYTVNVSPANKLKVLMIGNSYADDTINYAYEIAKSAGIPVENILVADIYIGGCSLDTHWQNAQSNAPAYRFGLEKEGWFDGNSYNGWTMEQAITYADWDFITLQQNSGNSGISASYSNLQNLMDYVLDVATDTVNNPNANPNVKLVWHQTWAYANGSANTGFGAYNYNQTTMYNSIQSCTQMHIVNKNFAAIIPNGTAIQNARTSLIGDTLSRDEYDHLSYGAGRYIAAMGLVGVLTGRDMSQITWKPVDSSFNYPMSEEIIAACKESFTNALNSPFEVTVSEYPPKSMFDVFEGSGTQDDPYLIQSADDMWKLSELTAGQSIGDANLYFKLTEDIDLGLDSWVPICSSADPGWVDNANSFNGNFDGNNKTVTFVGNYTGDGWAKGLFSAVGGYVHDLTLRGTITIEKGRVGSLASMAMGGAKIENVTSYVNITAGNNQVGGIIGYIAAPGVKLINCVNYGNITGRELVGGIVGGSWQNVIYENCANHGNITATTIHVGGIAGEKFAVATVINCSNDGTVMGSGIEATADVGTAGNYAGYLFGVEK